ncbi:MAG: FadR/GntR family transcriptional regulator [Acidimicrobiales bacterium]
MSESRSAEPHPFAPIERETVSAQVRAQLLARITMGELAPGAAMPSERELSDRFQVARTSVREAMQGLLSLGVVERKGNRSYVAEHLPDVVVDDGGDRKSFVAELFETRRVLEVPIFVLAAGRADGKARAEVEALVKQFDEDLDIVGFRRLDRQFHTTIASNCGNPLLIELYGKVLDRLFRSHEFDALLSAESNQPEVSRIIADSSEAHRLIASAFVAGDVDGVRAAAEEHLNSVEQSMVDDLD